jgi:hypothetical protein
VAIEESGKLGFSGDAQSKELRDIDLRMTCGLFSATLCALGVLATQFPPCALFRYSPDLQSFSS